MLQIWPIPHLRWRLLQRPSGKESTSNVGDAGWISGLGRSPGGGNGNPLQYSCLKNLIEESDRLQSKVLQMVRHNCSQLAWLLIEMLYCLQFNIIFYFISSSQQSYIRLNYIKLLIFNLFHLFWLHHALFVGS